MQFTKETTNNPIKNFYERAEIFDKNAALRYNKDNELYLTVLMEDKIVSVCESNIIRFIKSYIFEME